MANFTLIREDKFADISFMQDSAIAKRDKQLNLAQKSIRRPLLGMGHKQERYAVLRVITSTDGHVDVYNTSAPQSNKSDESKVYAGYTSNILIQTIQESREEKAQVIQTFGDDFVYFFGERPVQLQISAQLLDSNNFRWHQEWWENYKNVLRGTQLVRKDARVYLEIQDVMYEGYITRAATSKTADSPRQVTLNFTLLVTNKVYLEKIRNRYSKTGTLTQKQLQEMAVEGLRTVNSALMSSADQALQQQAYGKSIKTIEGFYSAMRTGKPANTEVQALSLQASLSYLNATGVPFDHQVTTTDLSDHQVNGTFQSMGNTRQMGIRREGAAKKIKQMYELQNTLYKLALEDSKTPYYNTSIGEYPNRGVKVNPKRSNSRVKIISADEFSSGSFGWQVIDEKTGKELEVYSKKAAETRAEAKKESDKQDPFFGAKRVRRGVVNNHQELDFYDGKKGVLDSISEFTNDVQAFLGSVAQLGVAAANLYLLYLAGAELVGNLKDDGVGKTANGFFKSATGQDFDTFNVKEFAFGEEPQEGQPTFEAPSGRSSEFNEETNPTPFGERDGTVESIEPDSSDELVIIQPDFTLFEEAVSLGTPEIVVLE
jgi:hypothetical protein